MFLRTMQLSLDYKKCSKIASNGLSFILLSRLIFIHDYKKEFHTYTTQSSPHNIEMENGYRNDFFFFQKKNTFKHKHY